LAKGVRERERLKGKRSRGGYISQQSQWRDVLQTGGVTPGLLAQGRNEHRYS
jgi:hypothetical protein